MRGMVIGEGGRSSGVLLYLYYVSRTPDTLAMPVSDPKRSSSAGDRCRRTRGRCKLPGRGTQNTCTGTDRGTEGNGATVCISGGMCAVGIVYVSVKKCKLEKVRMLMRWCVTYTVEPLLYDHPQNHIGVVV